VLNQHFQESIELLGRNKPKRFINRKGREGRKGNAGPFLAFFASFAVKRKTVIPKPHSKFRFEFVRYKALLVAFQQLAEHPSRFF